LCIGPFFYCFCVSHAPDANMVFCEAQEITGKGCSDRS
jgi:hypothetical protein